MGQVVVPPARGPGHPLLVVGGEVRELELELLVDDPSYGARPLRRMIQKELETALGRKLIAGEVRDGQKVIVDASGTGLEFKPQPLKAAA